MVGDFAVVPSTVTERDARLAFAHADAPAVTAASCHGDWDHDFRVLSGS